MRPQSRLSANHMSLGWSSTSPACSAFASDGGGGGRGLLNRQLLAGLRGDWPHGVWWAGPRGIEVGAARNAEREGEGSGQTENREAGIIIQVDNTLKKNLDNDTFFPQNENLVF